MSERSEPPQQNSKYYKEYTRNVYMPTITIEGDAHLVDAKVREYLDQQVTRIDTINERTKTHTRYIKNLENEIKKLKIIINKLNES